MAGAAATSASHRDPLLVSLALLTIVSGVGDAVSYLGLEHVFVANMTGNVVFLGFAAAGAGQLSIPASLLAIAGFLLGAICGGRLTKGALARRLPQALAVQAVFVAVATAVAIAAGHTGDVRYVLTMVLSFAMGAQNAAARALAIPDMTTTVLTLTLTGLAADSTPAGGSNPRWSRRTTAVALMLTGAVVGAVLVRDVGMPTALGAMLALIVCAIVVARHAHA